MRTMEVPEESNDPGESLAFQTRGVRWMLHRELDSRGVCRGGLLCDDVGLGKSVQMLGTMKRHLMMRNIVVTFKAVMPQWVGYCGRWLPCHTCVHISSHAKMAEAWRLVRASIAIGRPCIVICTYGVLSGNALDTLSAELWDRVVLDECHAIKNPSSLRFRSACALPARIRWGLSATPLQNQLGDVWTLMRWLRFPGASERMVEGSPRAKSDVARFRRSCVLSRTRAEVAPELNVQLQEPKVVTLSCRCDDPVEAAGYAALADHVRTRLGNLAPDADGPAANRQRVVINSLLLRLTQYVASPSLGCVTNLCARMPAVLAAATIDRGSKTRALVSELRRTRGHRSVVFCRFIQEIHVVEEAVREQGFSVARLSGATTQRERARILGDAWMTIGVVMRVAGRLPPELVQRIFSYCCPEVLVAQIETCGVGVNLTGFTRCYFHTNCWNPCAEMQCIGRLNRIGQRHRVRACRLVTVLDPEHTGGLLETVDARILKVQAAKRKLIGWWGGPCPAQGVARMSLTREDMRTLLA